MPPTCINCDESATREFIHLADGEVAAACDPCWSERWAGGGLLEAFADCGLFTQAMLAQLWEVFYDATEPVNPADVADETATETVEATPPGVLPSTIRRGDAAVLGSFATVNEGLGIDADEAFRAVHWPGLDGERGVAVVMAYTLTVDPVPLFGVALTVARKPAGIPDAIHYTLTELLEGEISDSGPRDWRDRLGDWLPGSASTGGDR